MQNSAGVTGTAPLNSKNNQYLSKSTNFSAFFNLVAMAAAPPRPNYVSRKRAYQDKDGHEWKLWTVQDNKHSVMEDDIRHHAWISHEKKQEEGKETVEEKFALVENCSKDQAQKAKEAMAALLPALSTADVIARVSKKA